jgi:hypothetical protein
MCNAKWDDEISILIGNDSYKFAIDSASMYTEIRDNKLYFDVVDADTTDDPQIINDIVDLKNFIKNLSFFKHIPIEKIKSLPVYFCAVELNDDDSIDVFGWEKIEKKGNQILINVSEDLLT